LDVRQLQCCQSSSECGTGGEDCRLRLPCCICIGGSSLKSSADSRREKFGQPASRTLAAADSRLPRRAPVQCRRPTSLMTLRSGRPPYQRAADVTPSTRPHWRPFYRAESSQRTTRDDCTGGWRVVRPSQTAAAGSQTSVRMRLERHSSWITCRRDTDQCVGVGVTGGGR